MQHYYKSLFPDLNDTAKERGLIMRTVGLGALHVTGGQAALKLQCCHLSSPCGNLGVAWWRIYQQSLFFHTFCLVSALPPTLLWAAELSVHSRASLLLLCLRSHVPTKVYVEMQPLGKSFLDVLAEAGWSSAREDTALPGLSAYPEWLISNFFSTCSSRIFGQLFICIEYYVRIT